MIRQSFSFWKVLQTQIFSSSNFQTLSKLSTKLWSAWEQPWRGMGPETRWIQLPHPESIPFLIPLGTPPLLRPSNITKRQPRPPLNTISSWVRNVFFRLIRFRFFWRFLFEFSDRAIEPFWTRISSTSCICRSYFLKPNAAANFRWTIGGNSHSNTDF